MAIKGFKQVIEKKGYRLDDKDRKIFEKEIKRGYFGFDVGDIIEFVIYDASDNQLPQEIVQGKKVRYISYTDENIQKYFDKVPENKFNKKSNNAQEYFIDTEKLIKEAGYSNGVFKTQITLLNRRLGSEPRLFDKVWIHEISPSRTEVRVLPVIEDGKSTPNSDLQSRYDTFVNCGTFTADVLIFIDDFINQFDVAEVVKKMLMKKGTISEGQNYIKLIEKEFKLVNFEVYLTQTKSLFTRIVDNYRMNRYYNPFEPNFGKPTGDSFGTEFDIARTFDEICEMASNAAEYSLPKQNIRLNTAKSLGQTKTLDKVDDILLTVRSNEEYESTRPSAKAAQIRGCTDPKAKNYNPKATVSSTCVYDIQVAKYKQIKVCNDRNATNYGKDGDCQYPPPPDPPAPTKVVKKKSSGSSGSSGSSSSGSSLCKYGSRYSVTGPPDKSFTKSGGTGTKGVKVLIDGGTVFAVCRSRVGFQLSGVPSWITPNYMSNDDHSAGNFRYKVAANSGPARSATITITPTGAAVGGSSYSFTVTQAGESKTKSQPISVATSQPKTPTSFLDTSPDRLTFDSSGQGEGGRIQKVTVNCKPGDSWSVQDLTGPAIQYGIDMSPTRGTGPGTIVVGSISPNSSTNAVDAYFTIKLGNITRRHEIYQYASAGSNPFGLPSRNSGATF